MCIAIEGISVARVIMFHLLEWLKHKIPLARGPCVLVIEGILTWHFTMAL